MNNGSIFRSSKSFHKCFDEDEIFPATCYIINCAQAMNSNLIYRHYNGTALYVTMYMYVQYKTLPGHFKS